MSNSNLYILGKDAQRHGANTKEMAVSHYLPISNLDNILNSVGESDLAVLANTDGWTPDDVAKLDRISNLLMLKNGTPVVSMNKHQLSTVIDIVHKIKAKDLSV